MFGLSCDFEHRGETVRMILGGGMIPEHRLNRIQARMVRENRIGHHLRVHIEERDLLVGLEFEVGGMKKLSQLLKTERINLACFYQLLLQVARALQEGELHMLDASRYALHEDYIFVEGTLSSGKLCLAYIPVYPDSKDMQSAAAGTKRLITAMLASVEKLEGEGVQRLLRYCESGVFGAEELSGLLAGLLTEEDEREAVQPAPIPVQMKVRNDEGETARTPAAGQHHREAAPEPLRGWLDAVRLESGLIREDRGHENIAGDGEPDQPSKRISPYYIPLAVLLVIAFFWKFGYLEQPSGWRLALCAATTVLAAAGCWLLLKKGKDGRRASGEGEEEEREPEANRAYFFGQGWPLKPSGMSERGENQAQVGNEEELSAVLKPLFPSRPHKEEATSLLNAVLSPESLSEHREDDELPYLERSGEDGEMEKITLNRTSFIIGRSADVAQYIEHGEGASRVHAEILRSARGYVLKDLDSRNGTRFKGEPMIPYKEYPLKDGDNFRIVNGNYVFRTV